MTYGGHIATAGRRLCRRTRVPRVEFFEPCALSKALRPPLRVPHGDGDASRYDGRDRRLGPLRWEVGRVREYITDWTRTLWLLCEHLFVGALSEAGGVIRDLGQVISLLPPTARED